MTVIPDDDEMYDLIPVWYHVLLQYVRCTKATYYNYWFSISGTMSRGKPKAGL